MYTKQEAIEKHGNEFFAYDSTDYYKPLAICWNDEDNVLVYDVNRDKHGYLKLYYSDLKDEYFFKYNGATYELSRFVKVNNPWTRDREMTIEEWKSENGY